MVYGACGDGTILDDNDDEDELKLRVKYKASRRMYCSNRVCKIMTRTPVAEVNTTCNFYHIFIIKTATEQPTSRD